MSLSISSDLEEECIWLTSSFGDSADFFLRRTTVCGVPCALALCDVVAGIERAWELVLRPLQEEPRVFEGGAEFMEYLIQRSALPFSPSLLTEREAMRYALTSGHSVLLAEGASVALLFS
ncbi:MAG: hypothetical protein RSF90_05715, partial [Pygmaiobacter sp.]